MKKILTIVLLACAVALGVSVATEMRAEDARVLAP